MLESTTIDGYSAYAHRSDGNGFANSDCDQEMKPTNDDRLSMVINK